MCRIVVYSLLLVQITFVLRTQAASFNCSQPPSFTNFDVNTCCRIPEINLGAAPEKCDKYVNSLKSHSEDYPAYTHLCYPECIYRETGSLQNGEIEMKNVRTFLTNNVNRRDKDIVPHIVRSFEACLGNINGHLQALGIAMYAPLPDEGCSPYASMVYGCVNSETFLHCPAKMWRNERHCNLAKSFAEQCNPLPHVPLPMA